jgi:hypothetical protein
VLAAIALPIEFAVAVTVPADAVALGKAVALKVREARRVPVIDPLSAGWEPV